MAVFHRLATRWLSRIEEDYSRSQVASYLAHTGGLCPEEDSVLRLGTTFHYAQDHAEQSRLKSLLMMRNETPERKAKGEGECFETHAGPESRQMHPFKKETPFKQAHQAHKQFSPLQPAALVSVPYGFVLVRVRVPPASAFLFRSGI